MKDRLAFSTFLAKPWAPILVACLGGIAYIIQLIYFSRSQEFVLDEGAFLYKGLLFASGKYSLYQSYGPWSNHMPLAFLIPGSVQALFGPGILTGRAFAIALAILTLLGIWLLAARLGNRWWAAGAIMVVALNPMLAKMYATAISQGLVIFMLTWALFLALGPNRPLWQTTLAGGMAGLILLTRINMFLVLPILVLYIFWEHGWKSGLLAGAAGLLVVIVGHALFWPGILQLWTILPRSLTPFLNVWRLPSAYDSTWQPNTSIEGRLLSFFQIFRFHFISMTGAVASWILWPSKDRWKSRSSFRSAVFLSVLFVSLLSLHLWFSIGGDYCVFCMPGYLGFFFVLGLLLFIQTASQWDSAPKGWRAVLCVTAVLVLSAGIGYSAFETIGQSLIEFPIPSFLIGSAIPSSVPLGAVLVNKLGLAEKILRRVLPIGFGFGIGLLIVLTAYLFMRFSRGSTTPNRSRMSFGMACIVFFLVIGLLLSPTPILGGGYSTYDCSGNVLEFIQGRWRAS